MVRGLMDYHENSRICGVILNRTSPSYYPRMRELIEEQCGIPVLGYLRERKDLEVPSRHLGLVDPAELNSVRQWVDELAAEAEETLDLDGILRLAAQAPALQECSKTELPVLDGPVRLAIAADAAFTFAYLENEECLEKMGAELVPFSPMADKQLPEEIGGVLLGGGYPERFAEELSQNDSMKRSIRAAAESGMPIYAECGGFLYLQSVLEQDGRDYEMTGIFPGRGEKKERLVNFGYMEAETTQGSLFGKKGTVLRGHEFHYFDTDCNGSDMDCRKPGSGKKYGTAFCTRTIYAGFPHFYFYSNPEAAFSLLKACSRYRAGRLSARHWDSIAKPLDSLGTAEKDIIRLCRIYRDPACPDIRKRALLILAGDHGVVKEKVTQTGQEVTRIVTENFAGGLSTVNLLAEKAGADVFAVDVGISGPAYPDRKLETGVVVDRKVRSGTDDMAEGPAMSLEETEKAVQTGREIAKELCQRGYRLIALGEMGIGNTTPTAVITGALLGLSARDVTGRGAGLSAPGLENKLRVVETVLSRIRKKETTDVLEILSEGGGLEIAAMVGVCLQACEEEIPVVLDGAITAAAALAAVTIDPRVQDFLIASHRPKEPAGRAILDKLSLPVMIDAELSLGEGSGAMLLLPLLDMACEVYEKMGSFEDIRVEPYERFEG